MKTFFTAEKKKKRRGGKKQQKKPPLNLQKIYNMERTAEPSILRKMIIITTIIIT